jgi:alkanesulfonate monooxygenase SsuD/methylene tetrahydromethanopterin reductase-like flavin-dependent oxidoreductase (luciferase family)
MRRLWCDEISEYKDEFYELPACRQFPKPVQKPHIPIHFGGESDAALQRVADVGQGWYGFNLEPDALAERVARLDTLLAARGRTRRDVLVSVSPYMREISPAKLEAYRRAGADQVILLALARDVAQMKPALERIANDYLDTARRLA